jgi:ABC-type maltose transport system permease subunit
VSVIATVRPDSWNFPLFLHVLGAMILVGGLVTGAGALAFARGDARLLRLGYWSLLAISLPGWVLMRIGAGWIYSREGWDSLPDNFNYPTWLDIGFLVADIGGLVLLVSLIVGGIGMYRMRAGKGSGLLKATLLLSLVLLAAYVVAIWAMAGKPA